MLLVNEVTAKLSFSANSIYNQPLISQLYSVNNHLETTKVIENWELLSFETNRYLSIILTLQMNQIWTFKQSNLQITNNQSYIVNKNDLCNISGSDEIAKIYIAALSCGLCGLDYTNNKARTSSLVVVSVISILFHSNPFLMY